MRWHDFRFCEGLRMPAHEGGAARTGAGVRKPPKEETALARPCRSPQRPTARAV
jgi:hypothetical protein